MDATSLSPAVSPVQVDGFEGISLTGAGGTLTATFLTGLGMVGCSLRHEGDELLAQLGGPPAYAERGSTFGLPLLHPWANRLIGWTYEADGRSVALSDRSPGIHIDSRSGLPIHGLLGGYRGWRVASTTVDGDAARLHAELRFDADSGLLEAFPFPHRLDLNAAVDANSLTIDLLLTPTGDLPVPVSFGFHPYLTLPGSDRGGWLVALPVRRRMKLDDSGLPDGESEDVDARDLSGPLGRRSFDDCFDELEPDPVFAVSDGRRRIRVAFGPDYPVAQVFAPPEKQFICFEPMTAPVAALSSGAGLRTVAPGGSFAARFAIEVGPA